MTPVLLVDTGALLALVDPRDQHHRLAVERLDVVTHNGWSLVGTTLIAAEFHRLLTRRNTPERARLTLEQMLRDPRCAWLDVPHPLVESAVAWLRRFTDQRFTLTDAVSFEIMTREGIDTAFAFDQHFITAGFRLLG